MRDMVEEKKVLLMKVGTLKNVAYSLTKSMSTEKLSWCRGSMGIIALDCSLCNHVTQCMKKNNKWENVGYVLYSLHDKNCFPRFLGPFLGGPWFLCPFMGGFLAHGFSPMVFYFRLRN